MHAQPQSDSPPPPPRHPAFKPVHVYHPPTGDDTAFRRTWEAKFGHRWVKVGGKYFLRSTPEGLRNNKRDTYRRGP